ncbi:hypothetical protein AC1031_014189 [Aphanomyces cochlioides]|nr:hypothetical protein AC1031_014189 [Aphanomyces cochlioides]
MKLILSHRKLRTKRGKHAEIKALLSVFESRLERELLESKEKIASFANVSRELARSQREVRGLHRRQSIQSMLKISPAHKANPLLKAKAGGFLGLQDKHLLIIFAFVGARDVLAISLTCHSWRSRIHTLFGLETKPSPAIATPKTQPLKLKPAPVLDKAQLAKADEMMKSFNAKEMKLFHDLVVRLKGLEANMVSLQAEKEDLAARLQGAENVRDFLMDKLTDVEDALTFSHGEKAKVEAQSSLDREVMAYLDTKAQELEAVAQSYAVQNEELKVELDQLQREHDAKSQVALLSCDFVLIEIVV